MKTASEEQLPLPGEKFTVQTAPGHWLLARLGKRVLRPGGLELTNKLLEALDVRATDAVVEFAPGLGITAQMALSHNPASYTGVEKDEAAVEFVRSFLDGPDQTCIVGDAAESTLPSSSATVIYGEAMLTMETLKKKERILQEAWRLCKPGARYGIHELCLVPDDLGEEKKKEIQKALAGALRVNARPLTTSEWRSLMESTGFSVHAEAHAPMHLLSPRRFVRDEGVRGTLKFLKNLLLNPAAIRRVIRMRIVFRRYKNHLAAVMLVGVKPNEDSVADPE